MEKCNQTQAEANASCSVDLFIVEEDVVDFGPGCVGASSIRMAGAWVDEEGDV